MSGQQDQDVAAGWLGFGQRRIVVKAPVQRGTSRHFVRGRDRHRRTRGQEQRAGLVNVGALVDDPML